MAAVLCTGTHEGINTTRKLILEDAGHIVVTASRSAEIESACRDCQFEVAVIGQTGKAQNPEWAELIRMHCPNVKILEIYMPQIGPRLAKADAQLEAPAVPHKLCERVAELSKKDASVADAQHKQIVGTKDVKANKIAMSVRL